jgi:glycine oxidase
VPNQPTIVRGAGIAGLWQALTLGRRGHRVVLIESSSDPFEQSCSLYAGAMLSPYCEEESTEPLVRELGLRSIELWRDVYSDLGQAGSLVVAQPRDRRELDRFARLTEGHERIDAGALAALEPGLEGRFETALYYPHEAHLEPLPAMKSLLDAAKRTGVEVRFGTSEPPSTPATIIDCRGLGARDQLPQLRGVRGERLVIKSDEVELRRPVRLLHPRFPIYLVPWSGNRFMVGATQIESEAEGPVTLRSALELLGTAYALHPAFGEAEIVEFGAGLRPAFADNLPRIIVKGDHIYVNGLYRHGFLLAPALAELVADHIEQGATHPEIFSADCHQR